jgi:hypothetical protein
MKRRPPREHTGRVLAVAFGLLAALAAFGIADGALAKLAPGELAAFDVFLAGFAIATYVFDGEVRSYIDRALAGRKHGHVPVHAQAERRVIA